MTTDAINICPITREPIDRDDELTLHAKSPYSSKAISKYLDLRGDLRDPLTREPLTSVQLRGVRSRVMGRLHRFWREQLIRGTAQGMMHAGATIFYICNQTDRAINMLYVTSVQMLHLCRPRYRSVKKRVLGMATMPMLQMAVERMFQDVEETMDVGYCIEFDFNGKECTMRLARSDGVETEASRDFPFATYTGATDFGSILAANARCPYPLSIQPAPPSTVLPP